MGPDGFWMELKAEYGIILVFDGHYHPIFSFCQDIYILGWFLFYILVNGIVQHEEDWKLPGTYRCYGDKFHFVSHELVRFGLISPPNAANIP